jgi:hypothetical protein
LCQLPCIGPRLIRPACVGNCVEVRCERTDRVGIERLVPYLARPTSLDPPFALERRKPPDRVRGSPVFPRPP